MKRQDGVMTIDWDEEKYLILQEEAGGYTWICYVKIK